MTEPGSPAHRASPPPAALEARALTKAFGVLVAVDAVSLSLEPGEIHALIGPNGAGKSTLVGLMSGWIRPDSGRLFLAGEDVSALSVAARARRGLGRSFQISNLAAGLSARRNVMLAVQGGQGPRFAIGRPARTDPRLVAPAQEALARVGFTPDPATPVAALSHGQRRQVEVACALALRPKVLLLDEPMAGLGPEGSAALTAFLEDLKHEVPILLIEHDMDAVFRLADRISVLVHGRLIASGPPEAIRADAEVRAAYLGEAAPC